ncbi:uncharacterized protein LOC123988073 [Osmia bicornis bicornis]|uniref:uncharacterized protein LOC123988073 n=1 Tax=Osmia bicornis bicornis TaxID=1437191 RepID=UPI001EAEDEC2|nr:uncharacterized protein LOC123988073 [Osmia bicornis bicornis]
MENNYQVLSSNFQLFLEKFSATAVRDGDREASLVSPSTSAGLAIPQPSPPVSQQEMSGVPRNVSDLGYVLKPPKFDGKTNWEEFKLQFEAIAGANRWDEPRKALALVTSLEGPARSVLTSLSVEKQTDFPALISALAFRYGTKNFENLNYVKFQNYKQRKGESISDLATEIERLAQAAFCECPLEIRDKLAASQFVSSLANEEMKRMLWLGGFTSLRAAVIRALEIEAVESMANAPVTKKETFTKPVYSSERDSGRREMRRPVKRKLERQEMECWNCKEKGHMWRNCPKKRKEEFSTKKGNGKQSA